MHKRIVLLTIFVLLLCLTGGQTKPCRAAQLQSINTDSTEHETNVTLQLDGKVRFSEHNLPAYKTYPDRCYVDLYDTSISGSVPSRLPLQNNQVTNIRTGIHATKLRVVLDLKDLSRCSVNAEENPYRLSMLVTGPDIPEKKTNPSLAKETAEKTAAAPPARLKSDSEQKIHHQQLSPLASSAFSMPENQLMSDEVPSFNINESEMTSKPSLWGWIQLFATHDLKVDAAEDAHLVRPKARIGSDWDKQLSADYSMQLRGSLEADRLFYDSEMAPDKTEINIHEAYLRLHNSSWDVTAGKQRIRWGKSDQMSPLDTINPQDLRQFITIDLEDRATPSWLLRTRWFGENIGIETVIKPWFQKSELEYFDSDWAIYRNLRQTIFSNPMIATGLKDYTRDIKTRESVPNGSPENSSAAIRLHLQTDNTDYALSYHYGWETTPTISSFPVKGLNYSGDPKVNPATLLGAPGVTLTNEDVISSYKRQQTVGVEWETVIEMIGFRGEIAGIDKAAFLTSNLTSVRKPVMHLVTGIDYTSESEWYFNLQGSWHHIDDYSDSILYFKQNNVSAFGEIRKPVWRGNLEFIAQYSYMATDQSSYLKPSILFKYFENLDCEIGAMIFNGDGDSLFGSYDQADQVFAILKYTF